MKNHTISNYDGNSNGCIMIPKKVCIFTEGKMDCNSKEQQISLFSCSTFKFLRQRNELWTSGCYPQTWICSANEACCDGDRRTMKQMTVGLLQSLKKYCMIPKHCKTLSILLCNYCFKILTALLVCNCWRVNKPKCFCGRKPNWCPFIHYLITYSTSVCVCLSN